MLPTIARAALCALPFLLAACGGASSESGATPASGGAAGSDRPEMVLGAEDAPVTVIEYASVTCPACANFHENVMPSIKENYIDTGKVRFVFREFPTSPQGLSYVGSVLARCAGERGGADAYQLVLGALYKTQRTWVSDNARAELQKIAAQAGMDQAAFETCIQRQDLVDLINENVRIGSEEDGVSATPSFIVDGRLRTLRSFEDLPGILDEAVTASGG